MTTTEKTFTDKVVLITGAGGGIGEIAARQFGEQGAKLILSDINAQTLDKVSSDLQASGIEVFAQAGDVSIPEQVQNLVDEGVKHFGKLDIAVNNAGIDPPHSLLADASLEDYDRTMNINVKGVFLGMKYQIPHLMANGGGSILNVASVAGIGGAPMMGVYAASKHAVIGLTKSAAFEYGKQNIRVNAVCPFITKTNMLEQELSKVPDREAAVKFLSKGSALKRLAEPEEVVAAILFACSPNNSYMTGHELVVDGGMTAV
jgi:NAD(P)-dependent dehydrogenase (short-subunit alcohol dehydrogenase family)